MKRLSNISEGLWSDIVRRGTSGDVRKEDEFDNLGLEDFKKYLIDTYKFADKYHLEIQQTKNIIEFPLYRHYQTWFRLYINFTDDKITCLRIGAFDMLRQDFYSAIKDKFELYGEGFGIVVTQNGKVSNSICIDLINTILLNTENPIYDIKNL